MGFADRTVSRTGKLLIACFLAGTTWSAGGQFTNAPSFGILVTKKKVTLVSKLPAIFPATGKTVALAIAQPGGKAQQQLQIAIEKQLTQNDSTIHVSDDRPDLKIECAIAKYAEARLVNVHEADGTNQRLMGEVSVIFHVTDIRSRQVVKSDTAMVELSEPLSKTTNNLVNVGKIFGQKNSGSNSTTTTSKSKFETTDAATQYMIDTAATQIAGYVVNTTAPVEVSLAVGGPLTRINNYATSGLWTKDLEELEVLTPYSDAKQDAYRTYNIGVANEALAYQTSDTKAAIRYLQQASNDYSKALDTKPEEKGFLEPQRRIKMALEHYEQIGKIESGPARSAPMASAVVESKDGEAPLTNTDIEEMVKNKMDEANVLDTIEHAPAVKFDLSAQGQIQLTRAGVNGKVLLAMKQRARGATPASTPPTPPTGKR